MASDPHSGTLELDLKPSVDQVGELHGQAPSIFVRNYLAISPPKSLFHFSIRAGLEVHGHYNGEPATLVTLKAHFAPKEQARPIKWAAITAYFDSEEMGTDSRPIKVEEFALGQPTVKVECSVESDTRRNSLKANLGVDQFASAGAEASREHETSKEKHYAATVSASAYPSEAEGDIPNTVRWILDGNESQNSGIPPDLTLGLILLRANDADFVGTVKVDIKVDWRHKVAEWCAPFKSYKKWGNVARHKIYTPNQGNKGEAPEGVEIGNMEKLTENGNVLMEGLVKIEMPVEYKYKK